MTQYFDPEFYHENGYNLYTNKNQQWTNFDASKEIYLVAELAQSECVFFDNIVMDMSIF